MRGQKRKEADSQPDDSSPTKCIKTETKTIFDAIQEKTTTIQGTIVYASEPNLEMEKRPPGEVFLADNTGIIRCVSFSHHLHSDLFSSSLGTLVEITNFVLKPVFSGVLTKHPNYPFDKEIHLNENSSITVVSQEGSRLPIQIIQLLPEFGRASFIGKVTSASALQHQKAKLNSETLPFITLVTTDYCNETIEVTIWGDLAKDLEENREHLVGSIIDTRRAVVRKYGEKKFLSVSNFSSKVPAEASIYYQTSKNWENISAIWTSILPPPNELPQRLASTPNSSTNVSSFHSTATDIKAEFNRGITELKNKFTGLENKLTGLENRLTGLDNSITEIKLGLSYLTKLMDANTASRSKCTERTSESSS
jgi:hypothetical protein